MTSRDQDLSKAVSCFIGRGYTNYPQPSHDRLAEQHGSAFASRYAVHMEELVGELNELEPDWEKGDLVYVGNNARLHMEQRHPELDDEALDALEWLYMWWWK